MRSTDRSPRGHDCGSIARMARLAILLCLPVLCLTVALPASLGGVAHAQPVEAVATTEGRLTVVAEGRVSARPDMATLRFGVERTADAAEEAVADMSEAAADLLDLLDAEGIAAEDRQTGALVLRPRWSRQDGRVMEIEGYVAATEVIVRLRSLEALGAVIDAAVAVGANRLDSLSFGLSDPGAARDSARQAAVAEGRRRAALYAEAAGVDLGRLVELTELDAPGPAPLIMQAEMSDARAATVPIAEGETTVSARLRLVYAIAP